MTKGAISLSERFDRGLTAQRARATEAISFRAFLESPEFANLSISPAVAAIADASEGRRVENVSLCQLLFACEPGQLPRELRRVVCVSAGGRGGKTSRLLAPKAVHAAWTVPLRAPGAPADPRWPLAQEVGRGEHAIAVLVAPKAKLARKAFRFVRGIVEWSPILKAALVGDITGESLTLRRPDGILVDIVVAVADAGGASVRGGTLVFCGLDEASFFRGAGYAVNDEDVFSAAIQRIVPYGQIWVVSTPWIAEEGLLERYIKDDWGRHDGALVAARVGTRLLNPNWDPDGSIERIERRRPGGNENMDREVLAIPLPKGTKGFFDPVKILAAFARHAPKRAPEDVGAGCDFGHAAGRDNSAYAAAARFVGGIFAALDSAEIRSTSDQKPSDTYRAFGQRMQRRGIKDFAADVFSKANVREEMDKLSIGFVDAASKDSMFDGAKTVLHEDRLCMADLPAVDRDELADQMRLIVAKPKISGGFTVLAPRTKVEDTPDGQGGGHCDRVSAFVAALWRVGSTQPALWAMPDDPRFTEPDEAPPSDPYGRGPRDDLVWRD